MHVLMLLTMLGVWGVLGLFNFEDSKHIGIFIAILPLVLFTYINIINILFSSCKYDVKLAHGRNKTLFGRKIYNKTDLAKAILEDPNLNKKVHEDITDVNWNQIRLARFLNSFILRW